MNQSREKRLEVLLYNAIGYMLETHSEEDYGGMDIICEDIADYLGSTIEELKNLKVLDYDDLVPPIPVLSDDLMTGMEYHKYILEECERQWHECQETEYGPWSEQSEKERNEYYDSLYEQYLDLLGKSCCDCCYAGSNDGIYYCNLGGSKYYCREISGRNYCDCFEEV